MNLDLKDRKLLYWLDQDSRATNKRLGKLVGLTEQAVGYRIKRLQEQGVIKRFVTFVDALSLGYQHYKVFVKLQYTSEEIEEKIIATLVAHPNVRWVVSTGGLYDLSFSVLAKSPTEFSDLFRKMIPSWGKYIGEQMIALNVRSPGFTRDWLLGKKISMRREYGGIQQNVDALSLRILKLLSQDARMNVVDIARRLQTSVDKVTHRLRKLKTGVIAGFTLQLDLSKLGYEYYSVFLRMPSVSENALLAFAESHPGILYVVKTIGSYDFQLECEVQNYVELERLLKEFRPAFAASLKDFEVLRVTKEHKYDFFPFAIGA
ncbi:Lrp/AsnC family transcriptional regulator [Candidatus Woesearchaeota archaeon]|nr:Lrp/AsnC family transcriptional regulator [Candidatus Woesearchaeota archaeon]